MNKIFLITGGNVGDRKKNLETAAALIEKRVGKIIIQSKIYETEAWGITYQPSFYNQILVIESQFPARKALNEILKIEAEM
jgi:2-amino-4-hydroxy-6-hydroxymethyldihydropteridine diphosphokinase